MCASHLRAERGFKQPDGAGRVKRDYRKLLGAKFAQEAPEDRIGIVMKGGISEVAISFPIWQLSERAKVRYAIT